MKKSVDQYPTTVEQYLVANYETAVRENNQLKMEKKELEKYAKHLAKQYPIYTAWQYNGKNGADSDNEKGFWRGMANSVLAILNDLKSAGLIEHTGLYGDEWPKEGEE